MCSQIAAFHQIVLLLLFTQQLLVKLSSAKGFFMAAEKEAIRKELRGGNAKNISSKPLEWMFIARAVIAPLLAHSTKLPRRALIGMLIYE